MKIDYEILKYEIMYGDFACEIKDENNNVSKIKVRNINNFKKHINLNNIIPRFSFDVDDNYLESLVSFDCGHNEYETGERFLFDFFGSKTTLRDCTFYHNDVDAKMKVKYNDCEVDIEFSCFVNMAQSKILDYRIEEAMKLSNKKDEIVGNVMKRYKGRFSPVKIEQRWKELQECQTKKPKIP